MAQWFAETLGKGTRVKLATRFEETPESAFILHLWLEATEDEVAYLLGRSFELHTGDPLHLRKVLADELVNGIVEMCPDLETTIRVETQAINQLLMVAYVLGGSSHESSLVFDLDRSG